MAKKTITITQDIPGTDDLTIGDTLHGLGATPEDLVLEMGEADT